MRISVVIPVYNAQKTIARCVQGLQDLKLKPYEVIFVDNGSSDETVQLLQSLTEGWNCNVHIVHETTPGAASARNTGADLAQGDWLAFTDSDCIPDVDWLTQGQIHIKKQQCAAMAGPAWGTMEGDLSAQLLSLTTLSVGSEAHWRHDAGKTGVNGFASANLWVNKQVFEQVQGFDATLTVSGEDYDLCARLYQTGHDIYYHPQLSVRHIHPSGFLSLLHKASAYGKAHGFLFEKYGQSGLYVDGLGGKQFHVTASYKLWINAVSAEKKMIVLLGFGVVWPVFWFVALIYPFFISRFLCRRAKALEQQLGLHQAYVLGWLLVFRSLAFTIGRMKGSRRGVWLL